MNELLVTVPAERFGVIGWSAGGPHALAAAAFSERVDAVALVGSMPPPSLARTLAPDVRHATRAARFAPRFAARRLEAWGKEPVPPTGSPETDAAYARGRVEAFKLGGRWLVQELAYLSRRWEFDPDDIRVPVALWWGDGDTVCPPVIGRAYADLLPNARLHIVEGTHQVLFPRWRDILLSVAQA